jgi:hypothetical protein
MIKKLLFYPCIVMGFFSSVTFCVVTLVMFKEQRDAAENQATMASYSIPSNCTVNSTTIHRESDCFFAEYFLLLVDPPDTWHNVTAAIFENVSRNVSAVVAFSNFPSRCGGVLNNFSSGTVLNCWFKRDDERMVRIIPVEEPKVLFMIVAVTSIILASLPFLLCLVHVFRTVKQSQRSSQNAGPEFHPTTVGREPQLNDDSPRNDMAAFSLEQLRADSEGEWISRLSASSSFARRVVARLKNYFHVQLSGTFTTENEEDSRTRTIDVGELMVSVDFSDPQHSPREDNPIPSECHVCFAQDLAERFVWWTCGHFMCEECTNKIVSGQRTVICPELAFVKCPQCRQFSNIHELALVSRKPLGISASVPS